jgi:hypothetical protein
VNTPSGIDFTASELGLPHHDAISAEVMRQIRSKAQGKTLLFVDRGFGLPQQCLHVVRDHLNLTGSNPLMGPNDPCGERFPRVTDVYVTECGQELPQVVTAGIKPGVVPNAEDVAAMKAVGADCWSYNLVPAMIVAAHAGLKVIGILVPEGMKPEAGQLKPILQALISENH